MMFESSLVRRDGQELPVEIHAQIIRLENESYILSVVRDISERKAAQEERIRMERLAATATLAGGFAHDINNLMASVMGSAELAIDDIQHSRPVEQDFFNTILRSAERASSLAHQLVAYSGGGHYNKQVCGIHKLIRDLVDRKARLQPEGVSLELHLDAANDRIETDVNQMELVVYSVLLNAAEAIEGEGRVVLTTSNPAPGSHELKTDHPVLRIEVRDNGKGMDKFVLNRVFEPFYTTKFTGRGMGLPASHGIVQYQGGEITLESTPGKGTTVYIDLPLTI